MKLISFLALWGLALPVFAQMKSGAITYKTTVESNEDVEGSEELGDLNNYSFDYTTQFNENYLLSKSELGMINYTSLVDRKTGSMIYSMTSEISKTVEFIDLTKSMNQLKETLLDYPYIEEEEIEMEEVNPDGYHEDFYKELLSMPPKDTVIIRTTETKQILGYNCKKVILKIKGGVVETVWYTEELPELNDLFKIHSSIRGLALSVHIKTELYSTLSDVTEISPENGLNEVESFTVPEGYNLDLGSIYVSDGEVSEFANSYFTFPDFVLFQDREKLIQQLTAELEKTIKESSSKEDRYHYYYFDLEIEISDQGRITEINFEEDATDIPEKKMNAMVNRLKKNVKIDPATVYGKPVASKLDLNFSGSDNEVDPAQYYDEEK
jgi:GLPGLI family protein